MKKVLIADSHTLFRDFLKQKLSDNQVEVILTQENRDTYTKMITNLPNLIILDMNEDNSAELEFLEKKSQDSNSANIPVVITGPNQDKTFTASLAKCGVIKYFAKPIKFDVFFESIGKVLHVPLMMDTTPCVLDIHRNGNIIFIEIAQGLNREKIALLQFKLSEMIEKLEIESPKIVLMLTNLELSFVDGYNLEFLIDNIRACPNLHNKNIKILSLSNYVKELLAGHDEYADIEMTSNLARVLNSLVDTSISSSVSDLITDKILSQTNEFEQESDAIATKFSSDIINEDVAEISDGTVLNMAIIDSDDTYRNQILETFSGIGANCKAYKGGQEFLNAISEDKNIDLIIMDIMLADKTGLSLLQRLMGMHLTAPIVIYSQGLQREVLTKIISLGNRNILTKPLKPNVLVQKCLSYLRG